MTNTVVQSQHKAIEALIASWRGEAPVVLPMTLVNNLENWRSKPDEKLKQEHWGSGRRQIRLKFSKWRAAVEGTMGWRFDCKLVMSNDKQVPTGLSLTKNATFLKAEERKLWQSGEPQWQTHRTQTSAKEIIPISRSEGKLILWPCKHAFWNLSSSLSHSCG